MNVSYVSGIDDNRPTSSRNNCVTYLYELETSLKSNPLNIESIDDGFFPPNHILSLWVTVNIYYNTFIEGFNENSVPSVTAHDSINVGYLL